MVQDAADEGIGEAGEPQAAAAWFSRFRAPLPRREQRLRTANVGEAQKVFTHRGELTGAARSGNYSRAMETAAV